MSNQEGMFYPQEQRPREQPPEEVSAAWREPEKNTTEPEWQEPVPDPSYEEGYGGTSYASHSQQEKIQPGQRPRWKPDGRQILALIAIIILLIAATKYTGAILTFILPLIMIIGLIVININRAEDTPMRGM